MIDRTRGTWKVSECGYRSELFGNHRGFQITAHGDDLPMGGRIICNITLNNAVGIPEGERRANAEFIAQAPEMFKACIEVVQRFAKEHHFDTVPSLDPEHPVRMCYEAIKDFI